MVVVEDGVGTAGVVAVVAVAVAGDQGQPIPDMPRYISNCKLKC